MLLIYRPTKRAEDNLTSMWRFLDPAIRERWPDLDLRHRNHRAYHGLKLLAEAFQTESPLVSYVIGGN